MCLVANRMNGILLLWCLCLFLSIALVDSQIKPTYTWHYTSKVNKDVFAVSLTRAQPTLPSSLFYSEYVFSLHVNITSRKYCQGNPNRSELPTNALVSSNRRQSKLSGSSSLIQHSNRTTRNITGASSSPPSSSSSSSSSLSSSSLSRPISTLTHDESTLPILSSMGPDEMLLQIQGRVLIGRLLNYMGCGSYSVSLAITKVRITLKCCKKVNTKSYLLSILIMYTSLIIIYSILYLFLNDYLSSTDNSPSFYIQTYIYIYIFIFIFTYI